MPSVQWWSVGHCRCWLEVLYCITAESILHTDKIHLPPPSCRSWLPSGCTSMTSCLIKASCKCSGNILCLCNWLDTRPSSARSVKSCPHSVFLSVCRRSCPDCVWSAWWGDTLPSQQCWADPDRHAWRCSPARRGSLSCLPFYMNLDNFCSILFLYLGLVIQFAQAKSPDNLHPLTQWIQGSGGPGVQNLLKSRDHMFPGLLCCLLVGCADGEAKDFQLILSLFTSCGQISLPCKWPRPWTLDYRDWFISHFPLYFLQETVQIRLGVWQSHDIQCFCNK